MKIVKLKNYLDEIVWHATYTCPGCGDHQERTLRSQEAVDALQDQVADGTHRCGCCAAERAGHGFKREPLTPGRWQEGSYSEKMRRGDRRGDDTTNERTET